MADQRTYRLVARTDGRTILDRLLVADGFWSRFVGLQFRRPLPIDSGLLIVPCPAIHTCFVRFALDLIWLDREGRVVELRRGVAPWRTASGPSGTFAVVETACGAVTVAAGESLVIESITPTLQLSCSLAFMRR
jgi:uncharacterized protein